MTLHQLPIVVLGLSLLAAGCAVAPAEIADAPPMEDKEYPLVHVELHEDGNHVITRGTIKASQQRAVRQAREDLDLMIADADPNDPESTERIASAAQAISVDSGCPGSSMWAYNAIYYEGFQICFSGHGTMWLDDIEDSPGNPDGWAGDIKSYWAGQYAGAWKNHYLDPYKFPPLQYSTVESFAAYHHNVYVAGYQNIDTITQ